MIEIDLAVLPGGERYEDRYGGYMKVFEDIAKTPPDEMVRVSNPPWCWVPLLDHLSCLVRNPRVHWPHCRIVGDGTVANKSIVDRTALEILCSFRPETADALWKCDMQWRPERARAYPTLNEFIITTNGSYHRKEVIDFIEISLANYKPTKRNVVLVPCAADKPYPSRMHQAVLNMMPESFYMMNATGVLGLVPQDLWPIMPHYDSGIPNDWRLMNIAMDYFSRNKHNDIIVYCDYYNLAIARAFQIIGQKATFVNTVKFYYDYIDLCAPERLAVLKREFEMAEAYK